MADFCGQRLEPNVLGAVCVVEDADGGFTSYGAPIAKVADGDYRCLAAKPCPQHERPA